MSEYLQFKKLLEYFVAHLNWLQTKDQSSNGYNQYIKGLVDSNNFTSTGQGYNEHAIQNQISKWERFKIGKICINVQGNFGKYNSVKCYLNWYGTGINITANWSDDQIVGLSIKIYTYWEINPTWNCVTNNVKIIELGLFDNTETESQCLRDFYATYNKLFKEYQINQQNIKMKETIQPYINLLLNNHNLILTGAPGTGKTYLAKQIASYLILGKDYNDLLSEDELEQFNEQCEFVQFHPSYDYTDFIEGLRPISNSDNNIGFERKNGIFKSFCCHAIENNATYVNHLNNDGTTQKIKIQSVINTEIHDNPNLEEIPESEKIYVFIIDEINRGELSKILGELFFSIDPGFRGPKGAVKTQYQNLILDINDPFYHGFYVPENVYIIGTMNDIDRSVESMDFAMRRRFAWKEITSNERIDMWDGNIDSWKSEAQMRMNSLNTEIESIPGFNKAFHIGPAYFLKLNKYQGDFESLWKYHIKGVLFEYLRGMSEAEDLLIKFKVAYDLQANLSDENN